MRNNEESHIVKIRQEVEDEYSNDDLYNINSWGADLSFRELITMYDEGELAKPEIQRHYVWDKSEASRFIESLLMGLPVPSIFLARHDGEKKLIVDGYQRIMSVRDYVRGIFSGDEKIFRLSNTEKINARWRNKAFAELPEDAQRKIRSSTIHAIIFEQKHPKNTDTSLFQVFERINTGGRSLTSQEIRNCVYQGSFNSALIELNKSPNWRALYGAESEDTRMRDIEFILRFFALKSDLVFEKNEGKISLKKFLNEQMAAFNKLPSLDVSTMKAIFFSTVDALFQTIGPEVFMNISEKDSVVQKFHPTVFDSIAIATSLAIAQGLHPNQFPDIKIRRTALLKDAEYKGFIKNETMTIEHIKGRVAVAAKHLYNLAI